MVDERWDEIKYRNKYGGSLSHYDYLAERALEFKFRRVLIRVSGKGLLIHS